MYHICAVITKSNSLRTIQAYLFDSKLPLILWLQLTTRGIEEGSKYETQPILYRDIQPDEVQSWTELRKAEGDFDQCTAHCLKFVYIRIITEIVLHAGVRICLLACFVAVITYVAYTCMSVRHVICQVGGDTNWTRRRGRRGGSRVWRGVHSWGKNSTRSTEGASVYRKIRKWTSYLWVYLLGSKKPMITGERGCAQGAKSPHESSAPSVALLAYFKPPWNSGTPVGPNVIFFDWTLLLIVIRIGLKHLTGGNPAEDSGHGI